MHGLVGTNGAGKSTLLSILLGLVRPDEGEVRLFGRTRRDAGAAWLDGVGGFVESPRFYPYLSGRANLAVLAGLDRGDAAALIDPALELVGLVDAGRQKVKGYSLGMRQRLALAAAIIRRPALLILDEPTNGLDPAGNRGLRDALQALRRAGRGRAVQQPRHRPGRAAVPRRHRARPWRRRLLGDGAAPAGESPLRAWALRTDDDAAPPLIAARSGVELDASGDPLRVTAEQAGLGRFLVALAAAGVTVRALDQADSALETLLLRLHAPTGKTQPGSRTSRRPRRQARP